MNLFILFRQDCQTYMRTRLPDGIAMLFMFMKVNAHLFTLKTVKSSKLVLSSIIFSWINFCFLGLVLKWRLDWNVLKHNCQYYLSIRSNLWQRKYLLVNANFIFHPIKAWKDARPIKIRQEQDWFSPVSRWMLLATSPQCPGKSKL